MSKLVKLGMLILIIVAIYLLFGQGVGEGFMQMSNGISRGISNGLSNIYSGNISDPNLYPLSYQLVPNNGPSIQGPNGTQNYYGPVSGQMNMDNMNMNNMNNLYQQPLMYPKQLYPKLPWYPKYGQPCAEGDCGATGACVNGICAIGPKQNNKTAFNVSVD